MAAISRRGGGDGEGSVIYVHVISQTQHSTGFFPKKHLTTADDSCQLIERINEKSRKLYVPLSRRLCLLMIAVHALVLWNFVFLVPHMKIYVDSGILVQVGNMCLLNGVLGFLMYCVAYAIWYYQVKSNHTKWFAQVKEVVDQWNRENNKPGRSARFVQKFHSEGTAGKMFELSIVQSTQGTSTETTTTV
eukprot:TRINITY_DN6198_c0_g1_i1.p1 TRINITY_DN6198_c0_g1~~TRINITY_DN6198_c0_g1_i1.p1  ORF type:complete len:190 (-),score=30.77 TRINITY_DN6198_c0_g1_i1:52-621(-)